MARDTDAANASPRLELRLGEQRWVVSPGESATIGRDPAAAVRVTGGPISRRHATVEHTQEGWVLTDHSRNGVFVEGRRTPRVLITDSTAVALGRRVDGVVLTLTPISEDGAPASMERRTRRSADRTSTHARLSDVHDLVAAQLAIGRLPDNDVVLDDLLVSRRHAVLHRTRTGWRIRDLASDNGTYLNGRRVTETDVADGDLIGVGHAVLQLRSGRLVEYQDQGDVDVEAQDLVVTREGRRLLDAVSFRVPGRSLLAILGPSGSGKSTLLSALTGTHPADAGEVRYGGRDFYSDYDELRQRIGLVPQDDILHPQLTVMRALTHAARLRFPPDVSAADREQRIREVIDELELTGREHQRIASLSGGQRKRTSVALELLSRPSLLFLDEPTSGLDPGLDKQVMRALRALADAGRTVVVVTHSVLHLDLCDQLLVLAPGGRVAYDGPPQTALDYFGAADFAEVFQRLEHESCVDWTERCRISSGHRRAEDHVRPPLAPAAVADAPRKKRRGMAQYRVLCRRTLDVILADRPYLVFLVLLPVLLSGLAHVVPGDHGLSTAAADPQAAQLLLILVMGGALMGVASTIRELVKERTIYLRERAIGLSGAAYLASKLTVFGAIAAAQAALFAALSMAGRPGPDSPVLLGSGRLEIGVAVLVVTTACMVVGLTISTAISNADRGMPPLVVVIMLQLVLSGGLFALEGRPGLEQLSWVVPSRWAYAIGGATMDAGRLPPPVNDPLWHHDPTTWIADLLLGCALTLLLVGVTGVLLRRHDPPRRRTAG
jgi:ABC-type multidrug transport system ATPase subunit/pSer/pThr/pTyr-binding forkhead associated (FHA) protein